MYGLCEVCLNETLEHLVTHHGVTWCRCTTPGCKWVQLKPKDVPHAMYSLLEN